MKELVSKVVSYFKGITYLDLKALTSVGGILILAAIISIVSVPTVKKVNVDSEFQNGADRLVATTLDITKLDFLSSADTEELSESELNASEEVGEEETRDLTVYEGYVTTYINVRSSPDIADNIVGNLDLNYKVEYLAYNESWAEIEYDEGSVCYISREYIQPEPVSYKSISVDNDVRKSFMDYTAITAKGSQAYRLQHSYGTTSDSGVRVVRGRYCIALGSYYTHNVGQYVDLVLEDGTVIPCIIGDCKADCDTTDNHSVGGDGSVAEFIVSTSSLSKEVKTSGDCSDIPGWSGKIVEVRVYSNRIYL